MISEAIVLAGGKGTRLEGIIENIPKPMAPINNRPFLEYLFDYLVAQGIRHVVLSTGYLAEAIEKHFGGKYKSIKLSYSEEKEPLGTGGAISKASQLINSHNFLVFNGDTILKADITRMAEFHSQKEADFTIALRSVTDTSRYGSVIINDYSRITQFSEKSIDRSNGLINGGVYIIKKKILLEEELSNVFSIEKDFFPNAVDKHRIFGFNTGAYFLDIGTPDDYNRAANELG